MSEQEQQRQRLTQRLEVLFRRHCTIMEREPAYVRGEQIAKAVIDNFKTLTTTMRPVMVHIHEPMTCLAEELAAHMMGPRRCAITCVGVVDPPLPAGLPSTVTVKRPCFHDEKGQWIAWMRNDMPEGVINPDVAVYYEAQGIDRGPWEMRRTEDEIEDVKRQLNAIPLHGATP